MQYSFRMSLYSLLCQLVNHLIDALFHVITLGIVRSTLTHYALLGVESKQTRNSGRMAEGSRYVWIPDAEKSYVKAQALTSGDTVECRLPDGTIVKVDASKVDRVNPAQFDRANDIAELTYLNEPSVINNIASRYASDLIYTYSGLFLVAVNPYRSLPIYGKDVIPDFKNKKRDEAPPHIFAVADQAFRQMLESKESQSILITGESGAGKTENTKKAIQFLSAVTGASHSARSIDQRILQTNPVLESFGNAQTIRNSNSSRFGKFIRIEFGTSGGTISGASIEWYLLEKSRVITQASEERNYHVFYQLLAGADDKLKERLLIPSDAKAADFAYLRNSTPLIQGVNDAEQFKALVNAFEITGFGKKEIEQIFEVIATVLHLGNIEFAPESADQGRIVNRSQVEWACNLLGVSPEHFSKALLKPRVRAGREFLMQSRTAAQAQFSVDALAKALYERLFGYIVEQLNQLLRQNDSLPSSFIGVLDIAGFEIFKTNSFEQLCINYTNEKLQQFFNHHTFVLEQEEYVKEQIDWEYVDFGNDLQPTIDLIERAKPMGIFSCLDEDSVMPRATDDSFTEKLTERWTGKNPKFTPARIGNGFVISHYAGDVAYSTEGWLDKNKDPLPEPVLELLVGSSNKLIAQLFGSEQATIEAAANTKRGKFRTVAQRHKEQLTNLMNQLESTHPHFVRCIIPNKRRLPKSFDNALVLDQLRCNGVLEGIRIARRGYPNRLEFQEFRKRYHSLVKGALGSDNQRVCAQILSELHLDPTSYKVGLTKVFFRGGVLAELEEKVEKLVREQILATQTIVRATLSRRKYRRALHRQQAARLLASRIKVSNQVQHDPWWRLVAAMRPMFESKETLDNNRKDIRMQKMENSMRELREELLQLKSKNQDLRSKVADSDRSNDQAQKQISDQQKSLDRAQKQASVSEQALEKSQSELANLRNLLAEKSDEAQTFRNEAEEMRGQVAEIEAIRERSNAAQALRKELDAARTQNSEHAARHKELTKDNGRLKDQLKALAAVKVEHESLAKEFEAAKSGWAERLAASEAKASTDSGLQDKLKAAEGRINALEKELTAAKTDTTEQQKLRTELQAGKTLHQQVSTRASELAKENSELQNQVTKLQNEVAEQKDQYEKLMSEYTATLKDQTCRGGKLASMEKELNAMRERMKEQDALVPMLTQPMSRHSVPASLQINVPPRPAANVQSLPHSSQGQTSAPSPFHTNLSPRGRGKPLPSSKSDLEQALSDRQREIVTATSKIAQLEQELEAVRHELADAALLRPKLEKVQREKAQLVNERSKLMFSSHEKLGAGKSLDIDRATSDEVKKLQSELKILKLRLVKAERDEQEARARAEGLETVESLQQQLRALRLANEHLRDQIPQQRQSSGQYSSHPDVGMHKGLDAPQLVVRKRDVGRALRVISNDRRVSESQIRAGPVASADVEDSLNFYRSRANEIHKKLENAELVVQAAKRAEDSAIEQLNKMRERYDQMDAVHQQDIMSLRRTISSLQSELAEKDMTVATSEESEKRVRMMESKLVALQTTLDEVSQERDRLSGDKHKLERRLSTSWSLDTSANDGEKGMGPRGLRDQLAKAKVDLNTQYRVASDLKWQIERKERYAEQLKRSLKDSDSRIEQIREHLDRVQASESAKDVALRRATREISGLREEVLLRKSDLETIRTRMQRPQSVPGRAFV